MALNQPEAQWIGVPPSTRPTITIGVPVRNGQDHLRRALDSLLSQTFPDFEILISDNQSEDGTWELCQEYVDLDQRIRAFRQPANLGANSNFNFLFENATGEFFKWAGHDDRWDPAFLSKCLEALAEDPRSVLAYCGESYRDDDNRELMECNRPYVITGDQPDERFRQWMSAMESPKEGRSDLVYGVIRADSLRRTRMFTNTLFTNQLLVLELATIGPFRYLPEVLVWRTPAPHRTVQERIRRMDPTSNPTSKGPHWKLAMEFLRVAAGLDVSPRRRLTLQLACVRFFLSGIQGRRLLWDLRRAAVQTITRSS